MKCKKGPKEHGAIHRARSFENEVNNEDEASSQSSTDDLGECSHESSKADRVVSDTSNKKRLQNCDNNDYSSSKTLKMKVRKKKEEKLSCDDFDYEEEDSSVHKHNKKRRKSERGRNSSNGSVDNSSASAKKKSQKSKKRSKQEKSDELPIAEILKKAQEQQLAKYVDPTPLAKLTADTIYVQGRNGFNPIKIISNDKNSRRNLNAGRPSFRSRPVKIAVIFQSIWRSVGSISQGLLGGIALLHLILIKTYFNDSEDFASGYSVFSEIHSSAFSFFIAIALIATFDKFDLGHVGAEYHWRVIFRKRFISIMSIPLYVTAFVLHQITAKVDDKLMLVHYNSSNITYTYPVNSSNETADIKSDEIEMWSKLTLSKDIVTLLGWIFLSVDNQKDMFLRHLEEMNNYAENVNMPI